MKETGKAEPMQHLGGFTNYFWGDGKQIGPGMMYGMMTTKNYDLPPVLKEIARDSSNVIIKQNNGLDISELKEEGYYGTDNRSMMMQWGMECFYKSGRLSEILLHIFANTICFPMNLSAILKFLILLAKLASP